jgi:L-aspartate oxidase
MLNNRMSTDKKPKDRVVQTDVLVIGSGLAGLLTSLILLRDGVRVVLACKGTLAESNTSFAQGGLAAVTAASTIDSPAQHLADTSKSGAGLTDEVAAKMIIEHGESLISCLTQLGVPFDAHSPGRFDLALEGGHCAPRVLHNKDTTGKAISSTLIDRLLERSKAPDEQLQILESAFARELIISEGRCIGARFSIADESVQIVARTVVLATGGLGQVFARTTNPKVATGDGIALAYRAGARLVDMEFVQFHPTAFINPTAPAFLISEAVRGAGAILLDKDGNRFAMKFHPDGELATRDVVARAIQSTMLATDSPVVLLDCRPIGSDAMENKFPNIINTCRGFGIDPIVEPIPVCPAAHYFMGGIWTDLSGRTTIENLYAIGECASVGLHGANRLASNSLLEAGVMAMRIAKYLASRMTRFRLRALELLDEIPEDTSPLLVPENLQEFRNTMYSQVGLVRSRTGLEQALNEMRANTYLAQRDQLSNQYLEAANIRLLGELIASSALRRKESRGAHFREDYPNLDDIEFHRRLAVSKYGWTWLQPTRAIARNEKIAAVTITPTAMKQRKVR